LTQDAAQGGRCPWSLHGDHRGAGSLRDRHCPIPRLALDPFQHPGSGGGIADQPIAVLEAVGDQVVDDAAALIEHGAVEGGAGRLQARHVIGEQLAQPLLGVGAGNVQDGHVADIEQPGVAARPVMFLQLGAIVQGHFPARERHHARTRGDVDFVQWRASTHGGS